MLLRWSEIRHSRPVVFIEREDRRRLIAERSRLAQPLDQRLDRAISAIDVATLSRGQGEAGALHQRVELGLVDLGHSPLLALIALNTARSLSLRAERSNPRARGCSGSPGPLRGLAMTTQVMLLQHR